MIIDRPKRIVKRIFRSLTPPYQITGVRFSMVGGVPTFLTKRDYILCCCCGYWPWPPMADAEAPTLEAHNLAISPFDGAAIIWHEDEVAEEEEECDWARAYEWRFEEPAELEPVDSALCVWRGTGDVQSREILPSESGVEIGAWSAAAELNIELRITVGYKPDRAYEIEVEGLTPVSLESELPIGEYQEIIDEWQCPDEGDSGYEVIGIEVKISES